jgi:ElaB/YqjD/DUF883 family membrane-anchored ribosome-binding protein
MKDHNEHASHAHGSHAAGAADVTESVGNIGRDLRDLGSNVKHAATEQYEQVRDRAKDYFESGRQRAEDFEHGIEGYIQDEPLKSVLIAAGVGLLIGVLWRRR